MNSFSSIFTLSWEFTANIFYMFIFRFPLIAYMSNSEIALAETLWTNNDFILFSICETSNILVACSYFTYSQFYYTLMNILQCRLNFIFEFHSDSLHYVWSVIFIFKSCYPLLIRGKVAVRPFMALDRNARCRKINRLHFNNKYMNIKTGFDHTAILYFIYFPKLLLTI